jgi:flagellar basal body-associated protein FliL
MDTVKAPEFGSMLKKAQRENTRFVALMFVTGVALAAAFVSTYWHFSKSPDKLFHCIVLGFAVGYSFPAVMTFIRIAIKGYFLGIEQAERLTYAIDGLKQAQDRAPNLIDDAKNVVEKAVPIAHNVEEIVSRAKGMADDVEAVVHKVRVTMDSLNGSLDVKAIESRIREANESLKTIAEAFSPGGVKS